MVVGLSGQSFTASQGTAIAPNDTVQPSGYINFSSRNSSWSSSSQVDVTEFSMSTSVGTAVLNNTAILSGVSAEFNLGSIVGLGGAVANLTGLSATARSLDPNDMTLGISGQSFSASIGSISVVDMQVGLTGQSATLL